METIGFLVSHYFFMADELLPMVYAELWRLAAGAMRQILIDRARAKKSVKRNAGRRVELHDVAETMPEERLLDVDEALRKLAMLKPGHAELLELRFFAGLSNDEAAKVLDVSPSTADRMARYAYAWLRVELADDDTAPLSVGS